MIKYSMSDTLKYKLTIHNIMYIIIKLHEHYFGNFSEH